MPLKLIKRYRRQRKLFPRTPRSQSFWPLLYLCIACCAVWAWRRCHRVTSGRRTEPAWTAASSAVDYTFQSIQTFITSSNWADDEVPWRKHAMMYIIKKLKSLSIVCGFHSHTQQDRVCAHTEGSSHHRLDSRRSLSANQQSRWQHSLYLVRLVVIISVPITYPQSRIMCHYAVVRALCCCGGRGCSWALRFARSHSDRSRTALAGSQPARRCPKRGYARRQPPSTHRDDKPQNNPS